MDGDLEVWLAQVEYEAFVGWLYAPASLAAFDKRSNGSINDFSINNLSILSISFFGSCIVCEVLCVYLVPYRALCGGSAVQLHPALGSQDSYMPELVLSRVSWAA